MDDDNKHFLEFIKKYFASLHGRRSPHAYFNLTKDPYEVILSNTDGDLYEEFNQCKPCSTSITRIFFLRIVKSLRIIFTGHAKAHTGEKMRRLCGFWRIRSAAGAISRGNDGNE